MDYMLKTDLNIVALVVCAVMYITSLRVSERNMLHNRLFRTLILATSSLLALEAMCWFVDGRPGLPAFVVSFAGEMLIYMLTPLPSLVWALYVNDHLLHDRRRLRQAAVALTIPAAVSTLVTLTSPFTGAMFTISSANVYQRGPLFPLLTVVAFLPIVYSFARCILYHKRLSRRIFAPLSLFAVPPVIGAVLQIVFYGTTLIWSSITISIFIVHASVQSRQYNIDHLTGVFSRHPLENVLRDRIDAARAGRSFACIMLDIDNFKSINDAFGHVAGDEALREAASILRSCIRADDFLARYAGDEFIIVVEANSLDVPRRIAERIRKGTDVFNRSGGKPYALSFSAGLAVYEAASGLDSSGFLAFTDSLMYREKKTKKALYASIASV